jgi:TP53 regulating kinase-like protein
MHDAHIIHGDLTTSNLLLRSAANSKKLVFIDFGLAKLDCRSSEDKAVDLYVLERAFLSTHPSLGGMFQLIVDTYVKASTMGKQVKTRLEKGV